MYVLTFFYKHIVPPEVKENIRVIWRGSEEINGMNYGECHMRIRL